MHGANSLGKFVSFTCIFLLVESQRLFERCLGVIQCLRYFIERGLGTQHVGFGLVRGRLELLILLMIRCSLVSFLGVTHKENKKQKMILVAKSLRPSELL
jgi:hypothetical protein